MYRILLCDDSAFVLTLFEKRLSAHKLTVVAKARDGEEGVRMFRQHRPDIMLLDITMPNKDGRTALREILAEFPDARVLMITAILSEEIKADCLRLGAGGYVSKDALQTDEKFDEEVIPLLHQLMKRKAA